MVTLIVPLAAALAGSLAWAAASGRLSTSLLHHHPSDLPPAVQQQPPPSHSSIARPPDATTASPDPAPEPEPPVAEPVAVPPARPRAPVVAAQPRPDPSVAGADEALYARAHRLHFVDHDPAAALAAWDAYLRAFPRGRLAPESRYNRALCLVRLGRRDEASAALAGFARGSYGGYRQSEARALIEAMGNAPP
jgi:hypothetical protein